MKRLKRSAIVLSLIEALYEKNSWCGETHIQKTTYFLEELLKVPLGFDFILYKHGPFSFDLSDELMAMRADMIVKLESRPPYGPGILLGRRSKLLKKLFPKTLKKYERKVKFIANELASYGVADLERIATALYVTLEAQRSGNDNVEYKTSRIHTLKPHILLEKARRALENESQIAKKARKLVEAI